MVKDVVCTEFEMRPAPIRLPFRLYMLLSGISQKEALNCGSAGDVPAAAEIGASLKATMNRWQVDGLDIENGRVDYQKLAQSRVFDEYRRLVPALRSFDPAVFRSHDERKAFWINIYNVLMIHGLIAYRAKASVREIRGAFERIAYIIGGLRYSLDDIEHGILRANRAHIVLPGLRFSDDDPRRQFVLDELDARVHFALVCGSNSCPPIGIYQADKLDDQLNLAARSFVNGGGVVLNKAKMSVSLSRIFQWYSSDFGGGWMGLGNQAAVLAYVSRYLVSEADSRFILAHADDLRVKYQKYDWSLNA